MKKIFLSISALFLYSGIFSQADPNNQVLVYFNSGAQRVAPSYTTSSITSQNILNVLNNYSIPSSNVIPSFPVFNESDTVTIEIGESSRQMNRAKVFTITVSNPNTKTNFINALNGLSEVLYAESNGTASNNIIPIDGRFGQQWGMRNTIVPGADIHLDGATNIFTGNPNSIIAIIDNGVDVNHDDLDTKILGGNIGFVIDVDDLGRQISHGSHVAGIAAAISNNGGNNGVAGVDWQARIQPRNIFDGNGDPDITTSIIDAVNFNANVWTFNNSWGLTYGRDEFNKPIPGRYSVTVRSAFAQAYRNNRVQCVAMGNHQVYTSGRYANIVAFPAGFNSGIIAVGATDVYDNIGDFSAQGSHIDVSAPGVNIWSTNFNNEYIDLSGTSMATPHVAGLASLLKGFNTNLANDDIEQIIRLSSDDANGINNPGFDNQMGTGRINAERALQFLQAPNTVQHLSVTGGTVFSTSASMTRVFLGVPGLPDAAYFVKRSEVRKAITLPVMCTTVGVWGRGVGTTGYREEQGRNFGEGICEIVPGTLTNTNATLRTWIYEVWTTSGQYLGFYPKSANNVVFQYTILGRQGAAPISLSAEQLSCNEIQLNVSGNNGTVYNWSVNYGDILFNGTTTTAVTTTPTIYAVGTTGTVSVTATNPCAVVESAAVAYEPFIREIQGLYPEYICADHVSVSINTTAYDTYYKWYVNNSLVKEGSDAYIYCTCDYQNPDARVNGENTIRVEVETDCGITSSFDADFFMICGFYTTQSNVELFPNPAREQVTINLKQINAKQTNGQLTDIREVKIMDKLGAVKKVMKYAASTKTIRINVSNLPLNIYYIEVSDGRNNARLPLSIQK